MKSGWEMEDLMEFIEGCWCSRCEKGKEGWSGCEELTPLALHPTAKEWMSGVGPTNGYVFASDFVYVFATPDTETKKGQEEALWLDPAAEVRTYSPTEKMPSGVVRVVTNEQRTGFKAVIVGRVPVTVCEGSPSGRMKVTTLKTGSGGNLNDTDRIVPDDLREWRKIINHFRSGIGEQGSGKDSKGNLKQLPSSGEAGEGKSLKATG
jgi:hypothetical protein